MTHEFFEGAAGTGKTFNLVRRAEELIRQGTLGERQKLLALTFMNGSRRRLEARLSANPVFQRRFECQTFDAFARVLATRRRSLITPAHIEQTAAMNEFDGPCHLAGTLLEMPEVRAWVHRSFPLVLVDEAQDLDDRRLKILRALAQSCRVLAAADAFQCLSDGRNTTELMAWLESWGPPQRLTDPQRTDQSGLLAAALAVREGRDVRSVLTSSTFRTKMHWEGHGFKLFEVPATSRHPQLLSWSISDDLIRRTGQFAILTPDSGNAIIRESLNIVRTRQWTRKNGSAFGPFGHAWERQDDEAADEMVATIAVPATATFSDLRAVLAPAAARFQAVARALDRMDRLRRTQGQTTFTADAVKLLVRDAVRSQTRMGIRAGRGNLVMTIQRAKNREFPNVVVLWPHTATGSAEHLRRLLYNAITRAQRNCTVMVLGKGRLNAPPFAP